MKILFAYGYSEETTPIYLERALRKHHEVVTCGPAKGRSQDIPTEQSASLLEVFDRLPSGFWPDLVFWSESSFRLLLTDVERSPVPTAGYNTEPQLALFWIKEYARLFDYVFTSGLPEMAHFQTEGGPEVHFLPMATDPETHGHLVDAPEIYDLCFLGTYNPNVYPERGRYIDRILSLADRHGLKVHIANGIYGREFGRIQAQSKIVFNHSFAGQNLNMRVFEALAAGRLLLTDRCAWSRVPEMFHDGEHLVYFDDLKNFEERLFYYLEHPQERQRIAANGRAEVLRHHTYDNRADDLVRAVESGAPWGQTSEQRIHRRLARFTEPERIPTAYARHAYYVGFRNESISRLTELLSARPNAAGTWCDLASAHGEAEQYDLTVREARRAIKLAPNLIAAHATLAWAQLGLHDWTGLEQSAHAGLDLLASGQELDLSVGCLFPNHLAWNKSMLTALLTESVATPPGQQEISMRAYYDTVFRVFLFKSLLGQHRFEAAAESAGPLVERDLPSDFCLSEAALAYHCAGRDDLALRALDKAQQVQGLNAVAGCEKAKVLASKGEWERTLAEVVKALKQVETLTALKFTLDASLLVQLYQLMGDALQRLDLPEQAARIREKARRLAAAAQS